MKEKTTVLVVDDKEDSLQSVSQALARNYQVIPATSGRQALDVLNKENVSLALVDLKLPDMDGLEVLERARQINPNLSVIMLMAYENIDDAVSAMKRGAFDYLPKSLDLYLLRTKVGRALEEKRRDQELRYLRGMLAKRYNFPSMLGRSKAMEQVYEEVERVAPTNATVLLRGESGTGKELVARAIHLNSPRRDSLFLGINCAALPEGVLESELFGHEKGAFTGATERRLGKFELANGGTLFLDEIGEVPLPVQAKLLRVLEQREFMRLGGSRLVTVDVRLITSTNRDLEQAVAERQFREDLYYRLKVVTITLPPLRERREDIPLLVEHFVKLFNEEHAKEIRGVDPRVIEVFMGYNWPGNVRELKNTVETMVVMSRKEGLGLEDIPFEISRLPREDRKVEIRVGMRLDAVEREVIRHTLTQVQGNKAKAARLLGMGLSTLHRKIKRYGLQPAPAE